MKIRNAISLVAFLLCAGSLKSQTFINSAVVEYEVKVNVKKTMGNNSWAEMLKENLPAFKTGYFHYTFADNNSVYKFNRWDGA